MNHTNLVEISTVVYNHIWYQVHIRKNKIKHLLSTRVNEEPTQQMLKQSEHEYQQTYYRHLMEIEKSYDRYISSMNHMAEVIPSTPPDSTDTIALYDRVIDGWLLLLSINDQCRTSIKALPDVADEEHHMEEALKSFQLAFGKQLQVYMYFTLCLCVIVLTGIGPNWARSLMVVAGSAYFITSAASFVGETARVRAKETEKLKVWLQLKQEIDNIHHDFIGLTGLIHDTIECVKTMWVEKKQQ
ncbi:hypothetical protein V8B55DRAFT_1444287 [Mucor lusitanicus]|uniref:Uncharacterized protein n=2 Tax=Mucor circinelloides f. lusitanicus TaxID=29924 RepID=A0A168PET4_MUCCL|nr:hypothetical protein FB192DRAFT_1374575 [Mucor lusitanicus]OAD07633.1 hypothetical protein MUCCIDRAFT_104572 [Mucor lusitanicus CBS 277.49]